MNATFKRLALSLSIMTLLAACGSHDGSGDAGASDAATTKSATTKAIGALPTALPPESLLTDNQAEPISSTGIRGDVLATALTQNAGTVEARTREQGEPPVIKIEQSVKATQTGNGITQPFFNDYRVSLDKISDGDTFASVRVMTGLSANKLPDNLEQAAADAELLKIDTVQRIEKGEIADGAYTRYQAYATHMQLGQPWSLKRNMVLMYGAESLSWEDQNSTTQVVMRAERGRQSSDFNLCTEVGVDDFSRVSCAQWRVPQNWKAGQALTYLGQRVTERHQKNVTDRYGNISGTVSRPITWRTR